MTDRIDFGTTEIFSDTDARRIRGLAIPLDDTAYKGGKAWRFLRDSVRLGDRVPGLLYHEVTRPVGRIVSHQWTDRGLEIEMAVSRTAAGDEALALAADGVLGFSVGVDGVKGKTSAGTFTVSDALCAEISLVPLPAFAGATVDSVAMQSDISINEEGRTMSDDEKGALEVTLSKLDDTVAKLTDSITNRPTPQPAPKAQVREELPYRFNGTAGRYSFVADAVAGYRDHDIDARTRLETFLAEAFVDTSNVADLNPVRNRPELYVDERAVRRPLGGMVTTGTLDDITAFRFPKFASAGNLVNPHTEGVEPTLATFTATSQLVEPTALSGKAELTRELVDQSSPQIDQLVWNKMLEASRNAAETRIAEMLDAVGGTPVALSGTDADLADDLDAALLDLDDPSIFTGLIAHGGLFAALASARDSAGRKLYPAIGPSNADGVRRGLYELDLGGMTAVRANGVTRSYLIDRGSVYQWLSAPRKLTFDIQVKSIYIGFWGYEAHAVTDASGVLPITYTA